MKSSNKSIVKVPEVTVISGDIDSSRGSMVSMQGGGDKRLSIHKSVLEGYGCRGCVWRNFGQCPHGFTIDSDIDVMHKRFPDGYCDEFKGFLFSLAEGEDSVSAVKEKFMLYTQEMQAMSDQMDYRKAEDEKKLLEKKVSLSRYVTDDDKDKLAELQMKVMSYRLWWTKLTDQITKGLARIADREKKVQGESVPRLTVQQLNVLINDSTKKLQKYENSGDDDGHD